jgi:hypothetical protein
LADFISSRAENHFPFWRQAIQRLLDFRAAGIGGQRDNGSNLRLSERGVAEQPKRQQQRGE